MTNFITNVWRIVLFSNITRMKGTWPLWKTPKLCDIAKCEKMCYLEIEVGLMQTWLIPWKLLVVCKNVRHICCTSKVVSAFVFKYPNNSKNTPLNGVRFVGVTCFEVEPCWWSVTDGRLEPLRSLVRRRRSTFLRDRLDLLEAVIASWRSDSCLNSSPTAMTKHNELTSWINK